MSKRERFNRSNPYRMNITINSKGKEIQDAKGAHDMPNDILIVYFTRSGNTRTIAQLIQQQTGSTTFEVLPEIPYPPSYNDVVKQAKKEIQAKHLPALQSRIRDIGAYGTIFIGTPNWWSTMAPPITTFLSEYDLTGKTIVPFCTHGGGGESRVLKDIAKNCPHSQVMPGFCVYSNGGAGAERDVSAWLREINIL